MGGVTDFLFGSEPEQVGTAQSPGQSWLQNQLKPLLNMGIQAGLSGQGLYNVPQAPQAPQAPSITAPPSAPMAGSYGVPSAPFSSPSDLIQSGELRTAQNLLENFYSGGGGGSAMGGLSGQGSQVLGNVLSDLSQGAVGRYAQMQLPYDQLQAQANQNIWGAGINQANLGYTQGQIPAWQMGIQLPLQQQNLGYTAGQIPQWQQQIQSNQSPWNLASLFSGSYGSPIVNQGQQGLFQSTANTAGGLGLASLFGFI